MVTTWDNTNEPVTIHGTAFWIDFDGARALVTNRHNIDPSMKLADEKYKKYKLVRVSLVVRKFENEKFMRHTELVDIDLANLGRVHTTANVAIFMNPLVRPYTDTQKGYYRYTAINSSELASEDFF